MRLRRVETVRTQTPSLPLGVGDHLRRPRNVLRLFRPFSLRKAAEAASLRVRRSSRDKSNSEPAFPIANRVARFNATPLFPLERINRVLFS